MPEQLRFSVVVPAYNEAAYLPQTLRALLRQDFPGAYEVVVVDNNSTDARAGIAAAHGVRVVAEHERGVCPARQAGSVAARGEIVISTDADTVQPRDWLSRIDQQFRTDERVVAVAGPCRYDSPSWWATLYPQLLFGLVRRVFLLFGWVGYVSATNLAFRRAAFPGYDPTMTQGGDELDLLRKLRRRGRVVWDGSNVVTTSSRRLQRGLVYSVFVSFLTFYLIGYLLNRLSSRAVLGMAPAFREAAPRVASASAVRRVRGRRLIGPTSIHGGGVALGARRTLVAVVAGAVGLPVAALADVRTVEHIHAVVRLLVAS